MITTTIHSLVVTSPSFHHNEHMPTKYTCQGENINPFINYSHLPAGTKSLALIMDDRSFNPPFTHWVMWNIDPDQAIDENSHPGVQGKNSKNEIGYTGPCHTKGDHYYHFRIMALDIELNLPEGSDRVNLEDAIHGHILGWGEVVGLYQHMKDSQLNVEVSPGGFR